MQERALHFKSLGYDIRLGIASSFLNETDLSDWYKQAEEVFPNEELESPSVLAYAPCTCFNKTLFPKPSKELQIFSQELHTVCSNVDKILEQQHTMQLIPSAINHVVVLFFSYLGTTKILAILHIFLPVFKRQRVSCSIRKNCLSSMIMLSKA